jgi:outer membrane receptor for ferrienterochelin and colicins
MKYILSVCLIVFATIGAHAQHILKLSIKNAEANEPLVGATASIESFKKTAIADSTGLVIFENLAAGTYDIEISYVGHEEKEISVILPLSSDEPLTVLLSESEEHEEEVIVMATRTSRSIRDIPTRVETISGEELAEKGNMKPGDIRMLLNESTGIQTQQTSATSYNSSIRIQGLDGRYTQILRDGFPLYSGFAGGLSIMQIAPLDLKQVEVIKGSSSTLYGGGAIAGLVNLVSKVPTAERELSFMANATSANGLDLSGFYSQRIKNIGVTVFGSRNTGSPYDPADIGLTAIPKFERYTINPRLFLYGGKTNANLGFSYITEDRTGGDINYIKNGSPGYFEKNNTDRFTTQLDINHQLTDRSSLNFKNSYSRFDRLIQIPVYTFKGLQQSTFSELTYNLKGEKALWVAGANLLTDDFAEEKTSANNLRNYHYNTYGAFIQNTWSPVSAFTLETGLRGDYAQQYGFELLPRISALFKITPELTSRIGGGIGYKTPTVFNEESEKIQFQNILPINQQQTRNERSVGGSFDVNYRTTLGEIGISANQLFFYTRINKPLVLSGTSAGDLAFTNADGYIDTKGWETNLRLTYDDFKLFIGYTYADVASHYDQVKSWFPLTARHRLNNVLMYEIEEKLKIGLEAYYFSPQKLSDGSMGRSYWTAGFMAEKLWEKFSVFINLENFTNTRQTKFDNIYTGSIDNPVFRDIYAPVEGFVANGGIKIKL